MPAPTEDRTLELARLRAFQRFILIPIDELVRIEHLVMDKANGMRAGVLTQNPIRPIDGIIFSRTRRKIWHLFWSQLIQCVMRFLPLRAALFAKAHIALVTVLERMRAGRGRRGVIMLRHRLAQREPGCRKWNLRESRTCPPQTPRSREPHAPPCTGQ